MIPAASREGPSVRNKPLFQFLSSGYLAPDSMKNQEPDGKTSLGFVPHHEQHRLEEKHNTATNNMRAMLRGNAFKEVSIKRYTVVKQFFLLSRTEDWGTQLST